jgi:NADH-ubiquinone oxidoreductase chain 5
LLCFLSIFSGVLSKDLIIGFGSTFFGDSFFISQKNYLSGDIEFIPIFAKLLPFFITISSILVCYSLYSFFTLNYYKTKMLKTYNLFFTFFNKKWYIDRLYNEVISQNVLSLGFDFFYKEIDRGLIEQVGPFGIVQVIKNSSYNIKNIRRGSIFHYIFLIYVTALVLYFYISFFFALFYFLDIVFIFFVFSFFYFDLLLFEF